MLQFWKKSGQRVKNQETLVENYKNTDRDNNVIDNHLINNNVEVKKCGLLASFEDEGLSDIEEADSKKEKSRLSKTLNEVLEDKTAVVYFLQYMESRNALSYIHCWLDLDAFKMEVNSFNETFETRPNSNSSPQLSAKMDHDSLSVSTDCDSYTADLSSLCEYSTATLNEKPQETNGLCDKDSDNSVRLHDELSVSEKKNVQNFVDSALSLFKKYIAQEANNSVKCPEDIRKIVMENICSTEKILSGNCFEAVQTYVYDVMENEFFSAFMGTDYFCKHQIDVLTSGNVILDDILYNETALFYFMEFLEQENSRNLLEFWIAATNFQQQLQDQKEFFDPVEAQNDAVVLYDKYFSLQALCPLGFSDKIRFAVEQNICGENGLMLDCFHLPLKIIEQVLDKNYLKPFLASQLFYKYLSELINTVQSNGYSTSIEKGRHSSSDCSSEKSFGASTFLALEFAPHNVKKKEKADMSIDTRELYDPDALWKRKKTHRLSLGRMTELGRYETDFEPEPDRKEFNLKNVMKKFVSLEEETKKKEEMAWQVAEMIVKDITSVTLNDASSED